MFRFKLLTELFGTDKAAERKFTDLLKESGVKDATEFTDDEVAQIRAALQPKSLALPGDSPVSSASTASTAIVSSFQSHLEEEQRRIQTSLDEAYQVHYQKTVGMVEEWFTRINAAPIQVLASIVSDPVRVAQLTGNHAYFDKMSDNLPRIGGAA